jgi:hypothetical protein
MNGGGKGMMLMLLRDRFKNKITLNRGEKRQNG